VHSGKCNCTSCVYVLYVIAEDESRCNIELNRYEISLHSYDFPLQILTKSNCLNMEYVDQVLISKENTILNILKLTLSN